jgi:hypothetical protein
MKNPHTAGLVISNAMHPEFAMRNVPQSLWVIPSIP